ncbi:MULTISPECIES: hypothetical protein [unclassified Crossiella]|uniref:hypothetical protein n=1 Tax=unclassified Crossiella TaxID=2620835 RepID=UPI001FFE721B|nr:MULTISPECIES: hypothetical protein [unclassified Crossiella]MCK2237939.1 hypothetical protein [Crossiella sp. S99.2]MCK2255222.1 hypothetical protein [Crossiella sp. S99.1]
MTISRLALRSAAGFTAVSLGLLACAGLASAGDKPQAGIRPNVGISITGLSLGASVGSINVGVNGDVNVSLNGSVGLDVSDGIGLTATVDADAGVGLGINALDGAVDADVNVSADIGANADVSLGDGIRKAATAKITGRQATVKAKPRDAGPQVAVNPTASAGITGLSLGAGAGSVNAVVVGNASIGLNCAAGAGVNGGVTVNASCDGNVGAGLGLTVGGNGEGRKSKSEGIRAAAKAKIAERAAR